MSYCRWSSMDWTCDLYCYEDVAGGWTTHVAGRRRVGDIPSDRVNDFCEGKISGEEFMRLHQEQMRVLETLPLVDIELPHAGETFSDPSLEDFRERLVGLRSLGYRFPDHVFESIDEEIAEAVKSGEAKNQA